jgi:phosphohistidine phosphatase
MLVYLLRHGEAEPNAASDAARKLTHKGHQEVLSVAHQFLVNKLPLDRCISSPYVRAHQTARDFLKQVKPGLALDESLLLTPEIRASEVMKLLDSLPATAHVLLVSHNPLLSELNALLTEGNIDHMHILSTSELVAVNIDVIGLGMGKTALRLLPGKKLQPD